MKLKKLQTLMPYIAFLTVVALFTILTGGRLLAVKNLKLIFEQSVLLMIGSVGVVFVMSMGGLDYSQGSVMGMICIIATLISYVSIPLALLSALVAGAMIGSINGFLNAKLKIPSFVATICMMYIFRGFTAYFTRKKALQAPLGLYALDNFTFKLVVLLVLVSLGYFIFTYTRFGRQVRAIGAGEIGAKYSGINVNKVKIITFAFAGLMAGFAAFMNVVRVGTATANTGSLFETNLMIALVLGGMPITGGAKSRYISVLIGGILLAILSNGLMMLGVDLAFQQLIRGVIFLGTVMLTVEKGNATIVK